MRAIRGIRGIRTIRDLGGEGGKKEGSGREGGWEGKIRFAKVEFN